MQGQEFIVIVKVTLGSMEAVKAGDVQEAVQEALDEFNGGTAQVIEITEQHT